MFCSATEIGAHGGERNYFGYMRLWKQVRDGAELEVEPTVLLDYVNIPTAEEVNHCMHNEPWIHEDRIFEG